MLIIILIKREEIYYIDNFRIVEVYSQASDISKYA